MYSTVEQLNTTVDCLSGRIWELQQIIKVLRNKDKAFNEMEERVSKLDTEKRNLADEKNKIEFSYFNLEAENKKIKKENKERLEEILKLKNEIEILKEKLKTKNEVKKAMEILKNS